MTPYQKRPEAERNEKVRTLYATGSYTMASLARMFKITRQRVHEIIHENFIPRCPKCGNPVKGEAGLCQNCI